MTKFMISLVSMNSLTIRGYPAILQQYQIFCQKILKLIYFQEMHRTLDYKQQQSLKHLQISNNMKSKLTKSSKRQNRRAKSESNIKIRVLSLVKQNKNISQNKLHQNPLKVNISRSQSNQSNKSDQKGFRRCKVKPKIAQTINLKTENHLKLYPTINYLKLNKVEDFQPPKVGYMHFQYNFDKLMPHRVQVGTFSKQKVITTKDSCVTIYNLNEYIRSLQIFQQLQQITFFRTFVILKCLRTWKYNVTSKKISKITTELQPLIFRLYPNLFLSIYSIFQQIGTINFISLNNDYSALRIQQYFQHLQMGSSIILNNIYKTKFINILHLLLKIIKNPKRNSADTKLFKNSKQVIHSRQWLGFEQIENNYQSKSQFEWYFVLFKKLIYMFVQNHAKWINNIIEQILLKFKDSLVLFQSNQSKIYSSLENKNIIKSQLMDLNNIRQLKIRPIQIQLKLVLTKKEGIINIETNQKEIIAIFLNFIENLESDLNEYSFVNYLLKYLEQYDHINDSHIIVEIIKKVMKSINHYTSQNYEEQKQNKLLFIKRITQMLNQNIKFVKQINSSLNKRTNNLYHIIINRNYNTNTLTRQMELKMVQKQLKQIPSQINVGIFIIKSNSMKKKYKSQIKKEFQLLYQQVPNQFNKIYQKIQTQLQNASKISSITYNMEEFIKSHKRRIKFEQYIEQQFNNNYETLKNLLKILSNCDKQNYQQYSKQIFCIEDLKRQILFRVQSFDLNCRQKLLDFRNELQQKCKKIDTNVTQMIKNLSEFKNQTTLAIQEKILNECQIKITQIGIEIDEVKYIQQLQIDNFIIQQKTKYFSTYENLFDKFHTSKLNLQQLNSFQVQFETFSKANMYQFNCNYWIKQIDDHLDNIKSINQNKFIIFQNITQQIIEVYQTYLKFIQMIKIIVSRTSEQLSQFCNEKYFNFKTNKIYTVQYIYKSNFYQTKYKQFKIFIQQKQDFKAIANLMIDLQIFISKSILTMSSDTIKSKQIDSLHFDNLLNQIKRLNCFKNNIDYYLQCQSIASSQQLSQLNRNSIILEQLIIFLKALSDVEDDYCNLNQYIEHHRYFWFDSNNIILKISHDNNLQWKTLIEKFNNIGLSTISSNNTTFRQYNIFLSNFNRLLRNKLTQITYYIKQKKIQSPLLYFLNEQIMSHNLASQIDLFKSMFPIDTIIIDDQMTTIITIHSEKLKIATGNAVRTCKTMQKYMKEAIQILLFDNLGYQPSLNIKKYCNDRLPLQIVWILDNKYLLSSYLKIWQDNNRNINCINLEVHKDIKELLQAKILNEYNSNQLTINYHIMFIEILIGIRLQMRNRFQNDNNQSWINSLFMVQVNSQCSGLKIFHHLVQFGYYLVNSRNLVTFIPYSDRMLVKIAFSLYERKCILVHQSQTIALIAARTMNIFSIINFNHVNVHSVLMGTFLIPSFIVCKVENSCQIISIFKIYQEVLNVVNNANELFQVDENRNRIRFDKPLIFIQYNISEFKQNNPQLRLNFRQISYRPPKCNLMIQFIYLTRNIQIPELIIKQSILIINKYLTINYEITKQHLHFQQIRLLCEKIFLVLKQKQKNKLYPSFENILKQYFDNLLLTKAQRKQICCTKNYDSLVSEHFRVILKDHLINQDEIMDQQLYNINEISYHELLLLRQKKQKINNLDNLFTKIFYQIKAVLISQKTSVQMVKIYEIFTSFLVKLSYKPIVLVGPPQSGKTYLIKNYARIIQNYVKVTIEVIHSQSFTKINQFQDYNKLIYNLIQITNYCKWIILDTFDKKFTEKLLLQLETNEQNEQQNINDSNDMNGKKYLIFELRSLSQITPTILHQTNRIVFPQDTLSMEYIYSSFLMKLFNIIPELNISYQCYFDSLFHIFMTAFKKILHLNIECTSIWIVQVNCRILFQKTLQMLESLIKMCTSKQRQLIFNLISIQSTLSSLVLYCIYWTIWMYLLSDYTKLWQEIMNQLTKSLSYQIDTVCRRLIDFSSDKVRYLAFDQYEFMVNQTNKLFLIDTIQMKIIHTLIKPLLQNNCNLIIIAQSSKTSLIKYLIQNKDITIDLVIKANSRFCLNKLSKMLNQCQKDRKQLPEKIKRTHKNIVVYIEDVNLDHSTSLHQKYLHHIQETQSYYYEAKVIKICRIQNIIERKKAPFNFIKQNWHLNMIGCKWTQNHFLSIFTEILNNFHTLYIDDVEFISKFKRQSAKIAQKLLSFMNNSQQIFTATIENWYYHFNYQKLFTLLQNYFYYSETEIGHKFHNLDKKLYHYIFRNLNNQLKSKKQQQKVQSKFHSQGIDFQKNENDDVINEKKVKAKIKSLRNIRGLLITKQIVNHINMIQKALKQNQIILINTFNISNVGSFIELALEIIGCPCKKIVNQDSLHLKQQLQSLLTMTQQQSKLVILCNESVVLDNPQIITQFYEIISSDQNQNKFFQGKRKGNQTKEVKFILQYSTKSQEYYLFQPRIMYKAAILWIKQPEVNQYCSLGTQMLQLRESRAMSVISQKNQFEQISSILFKVYKQISALQQTPSEMYLFILYSSSYLFSYDNYANYINIFKQVYLSEVEITKQKINQIKTSINCLYKIKKSHEIMRQKHIKLLQLIKQIKVDIKKTEEKLIQKRNMITSIQSINEHQKLVDNQNKLKINEKTINNYLQKYKQLKNLSLQALHSISRNQIAETKYLITNNFKGIRQFLQVIGLLLGQLPELAIIKHFLLDPNILTRIKDIKINTFNEKLIHDIMKRMQILQQNYKIAFIRHLLNWIQSQINLKSLQIKDKQKISHLKAQNILLHKQIVQIEQFNNQRQTERQLQQQQNKQHNKKEQLQKYSQELKSMDKQIRKISISQIYQLCQIYQQKLDKFQKYKKYGAETIAVKISLLWTFQAYLDNFLREKMELLSRKAIQNSYKYTFDISIEEVLNPQSQKDKIKFRNKTICTRKHQLLSLVNWHFRNSQIPLLLITKTLKIPEDIMIERSIIIRIQQISIKYKQYKMFKAYSVLVLEIDDDDWNFNLIQPSTKRISKQKSRVLWYQNQNYLIPSEVQVIFVKKKLICYNEYLKKFRVVCMQINEEDFVEWVMNYNKNMNKNKNQASSEQNLISITNYLTENQNPILSDQVWINNLIHLLHNYQQSVSSIKNTIKYKLSRLSTHDSFLTMAKYIAKILNFAHFKFSISLSYLKKLIKSAHKFSQYIKSVSSETILKYILTSLHAIIDDKKSFMLLVFCKLHLIKNNQCNKVELENLINQRYKVQKLRSILAEPSYNLFSYLPQAMKNLQRIYRKIIDQTQQNNFEQIKKRIENQKQLTWVQKMILFKATIPGFFEKQINYKLKEMENQLLILDCTKLYQFWKHNILFVHVNKINQYLSLIFCKSIQKIQIQDICFYKKSDSQKWLIVIDEENNQFWNKMIKIVKENRQKCTIVLSSSQLSENFSENLIQISFYEALNLLNSQYKQNQKFDLSQQVSMVFDYAQNMPYHNSLQKYHQLQHFISLKYFQESPEFQFPRMIAYYQYLHFGWNQNYSTIIYEDLTLIINKRKEKVCDIIENTVKINWRIIKQDEKIEQTENSETQQIKKIYHVYYKMITDYLENVTIFIQQYNNCNNSVINLCQIKIQSEKNDIYKYLAQIQQIGLILCGKINLDFQYLTLFKQIQLSINSSQFITKLCNLQKWMKQLQLDPSISVNLIQQINSDLDLEYLFDSSAYILNLSSIKKRSYSKKSTGIFKLNAQNYKNTKLQIVKNVNLYRTIQQVRDAQLKCPMHFYINGNSISIFTHQLSTIKQFESSTNYILLKMKFGQTYHLKIKVLSNLLL